MPIIKYAPRAGRAMMAGLFGLLASTAFAADYEPAGKDSDVVVSQSIGETRSISVPVGDLDMDDAYDRETLAIRIDRAAKRVCDINRGSKLDRLTDATECLEVSLAKAAAQLNARGMRDTAEMVAGGQL